MACALERLAVLFVNYSMTRFAVALHVWRVCARVYKGLRGSAPLLLAYKSRRACVQVMKAHLRGNLQLDARLAVALHVRHRLRHCRCRGAALAALPAVEVLLIEQRQLRADVTGVCFTRHGRCLMDGCSARGRDGFDECGSKAGGESIARHRLR